MSQDDLAVRSKVAPRTIALFELNDRIPRDRTLDDIRRAFEAMGITFSFDGPRAAGIIASVDAKPIEKARRKQAAGDGGDTQEHP